MARFLLIILLFIVTAKSAMPQKLPLENEIEIIGSLDGDELLEAVLLIYDSLTRINDHNIRVEITNRVFEITKDKDEQAHAISLVSKVRFAISDDFYLFEDAYNIAAKNDNKDLMIYFDEWQVKWFLEYGIYDKAMLYLLRLRDFSKELGKDESYRHALNILGDIYYNAKLMEQAKLSYEEILQYYIDNNEWNYWRPIMLMNNLGAIALFNKDTALAYNWFSRSLKVADSLLYKPYRQNTLAYTKLKLAEIFRYKGEHIKAINLITEVEAYPDGSVFEDVIQEYYYQKAMWYLDVKQYDNSLKMTWKLYPSEHFTSAEYRFVPEVYKMLSVIYQGKSQYIQALKYLQIHTHLSDSIEKQGNIARSIILLAHKTYEAIESENEMEKQRLELEQQKMKIINEADRKKQSLIMYSLILGSLFLIIIIIVILRSNLQRKKVNQRLNLQKQKVQSYAKELKIANKTKDKFFSIIAHDLKGPVGTLNNMIQLLVDTYDEIDENDKLKILISAGKSSSNSYSLLMNLLDWSRSQQGKVELNPQSFNVKDSIENVYRQIMDSAYQKKQKINIDIPHDINMINDISMFETVIRNLLSNSVKFTPDGGNIWITANNNNNRTLITVKDSGIGMSEDMTHKLFDISSKIQRKGTNNEMGTGLGLLLCREFIEKMGGTLSATSEEGKGSEFVINFFTSLTKK